MLKITVSEKLKNLAKLFYPNKLYVTGGYVRNSLLCCKLSDIDICSHLKPQEVKKLIENSDYKIKASYNKLGTLKIACGNEDYEYTTFRNDIYTTGGMHKPIKVEFCNNVEKDANRRDFTVNSIYYDITNDKIIDPLNGLNDLKNKIIKAANPEKIFSSDGLRLLRMVRFAVELNFNIEEKTYKAAKQYNYLLKDIVGERIYEELNKILLSDTKYIDLSSKTAHYDGVEYLKDLGLLEIIFPSFEYSYNINQRKDFHKYDVFEHSAMAVKYSHKDIRLAALLHDIGKGICYKNNGNFYGHENVGAEKAKTLLGEKGLKCSNKQINEIVFLIKYHMYDINNKTKENKVKMFIVKNYKYIDKLLLLKQADFLGCGLLEGVAPTVQKWQDIIKQMKENNAPFSIKELQIKGNTIKELGCIDKYISQILDNLLKDCVISPKLNDKEILKQRAIRYIKQLTKI